MKIDFDPNKNFQNVEKHGISFSLAIHFEWETALVVEDDRKDYGETRYQAMGYIAERLHVLVFTVREEETIRVISLRKANKREVKLYETQS